ncbi:threonine-phosphate decarboxylase CobD [Acetobacter thailandicus]|uniref:threonine-phosphate decarboxylase CobD n=1 Tax=Acetobacter thailandicus TaxID=1502842 RepID=UPI001BA81047|nr:threonine-phosphate decarboxylase CobD [Acetobacter thailandicus]MBS0959145.1 threonine-phosphate decarboxylase [Acetobacter thailandicus]
MRAAGSQFEAERPGAETIPSITQCRAGAISAGGIRLPAHGGQARAVMQNFPHAPEPYYDLSTGISPYAYPCTFPDVAQLTRLPEQDEEEALCQSAAWAYGVPLASMVVAGAGSQSLIALLPYVIPVRHVCISGPTYSGHEQAWRQQGRVTVQCVQEPDACLQAALQPGTVCVVCNPNNPDGRIVSLSWLRTLAEHCEKNNSFLIVDEAFADFEKESAAALLPSSSSSVLVLRSFGKTYGLPGVRLGFLLASEEVAAQVRHVQGSWPVGSVALHIGKVALADEAWKHDAAARVRQDHARLVALLTSAGLVCVGECALFTLVITPYALRLWKHLCQSGIVTRIFSGFCDRLRIGLPASEPAWLRLSDALKAWEQSDHSSS